MTRLFRRIRDAWVIVGIILLLIVAANALLKATLPESAGYRLVRPGATEPSKRDADFHAGADWADTYFSEHRLARRLSPPGDPPPADTLAPRIVSAYLANVRAVRALARDHGFRAVFFWQPTVFAKRHTTSGEQAIIDASLATRRDLQLASDRALTVAPSRDPEVVDLSALFDDVDRSVFLDSSHLSEDGNRLVAEAIVEVIVERFASLFSGS